MNPLIYIGLGIGASLILAVGIFAAGFYFGSVFGGEE